ncbi:alpha-protein kinase 1 isoform X2 [Rhineura floridana]|nr:alpha-protein kinase 1 isoform X2 [Rhineura floridana]XP_061441347.1 alpha-protein kinase 1 isoform X2 [Rhineura floridana]XP_061441348.1 alpha-protein kinase 1 isoform X2 [Rhineura floridana]XP_061441350.1 alpha-protein kinase 1 isoform X2 [Rhineura floridana]XP_061441351.1 alpha-protein kinase 1 isoform X2 [Rhineura floridana]XP_061441352.1 alpha-protein kinase 1 isoform X2 [Rhineura floridana]
MNNQKTMATLLQECKQMLDQLSSEAEDQSKRDESKHQQCRALLPDDLRTLIEEAKEMKWPFVPERWQYKQAVDLEDKTNLQDMISARLHELLVYLKASITVRDYATAAAIVFLIDRFLYWLDGSSQLLQIAKRLHKLQPTTPIAPQLVIRQARVSVNSGKLLKAEYILSSLINDNGATGVWKYPQESDRILVQSVCTQIRGQILQKLGMWYEAAELVWASIVGYFTLPQPDKKGIATSLGILADIFVSMSENDYNRFKNNYQFDLALLQEFDHRLLSAAEACKLAAAFSQFTPLFVLTAVNIRGTCLLSYSYSSACPSEKQKFYLSDAKESFEIGLLSKKDKEPVTSKQELHSFIKAAFCLTKVHQQLYGESERLSQVNQLCQEALRKLYAYSLSQHTGEQDKEQLAKDIMCCVMSVKEQLHVQDFPNSDAKSYIPDSYKTGVGKQIVNGKLSFKNVLKEHSQHHAAVCEVYKSVCQSHKMTSEGKIGACITALKTETKNTDTMCTTEERSHHGKDTVKISVSQKGKKSLEGFKGQIRKKLSHAAAVDASFDEETESIPSERSQSHGDIISSSSHSRSKLSSSLRSWSKLSKSSSFTSWEEIDYNENEPPQDKEQKPKFAAGKDQDCSVVFTEDAEANVQKHDLYSLASKTHQLSLEEALNGCSGPLKHLFQNNIAMTNILTESCPHFREEHMEGRENALKESLRETSMTNPKNSNDLLSGIINPTSEQDPFGIIIPSSVTDSRTKDSTNNSSAISNHNLRSFGKGSTEDPESYKEEVEEPMSRNDWPSVDPEGETVDTTEDAHLNSHLPDDRMTPASINSNMLKPEHAHFVQNWINESISAAPPGGSSGISEVDPQAETAEDWEFASDSRRKSVDYLNDMCIRRDQPHLRSETTNSPSGTNNKPLVNQSSDCATTEEDEGEKLRNILNSSHSTSSSLKSWYKAPHFSSSFSELGSPSFLNSSGSSFVFMDRTKEQILQARILSDDDYDRLLSGVEHTWLMERIKNTGLFKPNFLCKAHSALLLKYSKKSGLWTAQETAVYIGDYLSVAKKGKQRNAFWIHFLHQEETLGRYVGKEYKEEKELLHHFSDVERQMTAQYYVTEFNKRLYEQKIPTQIFYIPSVVLLVLEGKSIQGCVSVEPYILGEFVKLSNNAKVVKLEYKATEYGLAYGHFCYELSQGRDVVVDLQGWVTGNGKGLIYLTDPQIHSLSQKDASCLMNFGKKGIYYFFNNQHTECNEICSRLSLARPSLEKPN